VLKLGLQEFPGWDESYMPFNLAPVGSVSAETPPTSKAMRSTKMLNMNEDQKKEHWRRIDARQTSWEPIAAKKFKAVYDAEAVAVQKAVEGKEPSSMASAASTAIKELKPKWEKTIKAVSSAVAEDFGNDTLNTLAKSAKTERKGLLFQLNSPAMASWLEEHITKSVTSIIDTEIAGAKSIIENGIKNNLTSFDISKQLRQFYDESEKWKAMRVARTEVGSASNKAQHEAAKQAGATRKVWIGTMDDRIRDTHAEMNGEEASINEPYSNGLMFPCDPSGEAKEVLECRCKQGYIV
jgi:SPP1 gp7 family putative phage head morphogenesis protein